MPKCLPALPRHLVSVPENLPGELGDLLRRFVYQTRFQQFLKRWQPSVSAFLGGNSEQSSQSISLLVILFTELFPEVFEVGIVSLLRVSFFGVFLVLAQELGSIKAAMRVVRVGVSRSCGGSAAPAIGEEIVLGFKRPSLFA